MANLILPDDPDWKEPIIMQDAYENAVTPKMSQIKRNAEFDAARQVDMQKWGVKDQIPYPNSTIAVAPSTFTKEAQASGVSNAMTNPMWFSPLHTPQNWQVASKRREVYQWCHLPDTKILMADGTTKNISNIVPGDHVISHTGHRRKVLVSGRRFIDECIYNLSISGIDRPLCLTGNHKILSYQFQKAKAVSGKKYFSSAVEGIDEDSLSGTFRRSDTLSINDIVFSPVPAENELIDSSYEITSDKMFLLGLYAAEGSIAWYKYKDTKRPKGIRLCLATHETDLISKVDDICDKLGLKTHKYKNSSSTNKENRSLDIHIYNRRLAEFCFEYVGHGARTKKVNEAIINLPKHFLEQFLSGLASGDGHLISTTGNIDIVTANESLSTQMYFIASKIGIPANIYKQNTDYGYHYHVILHGLSCNFPIIKQKCIYKYGKSKSRSAILKDKSFARRITNIDVTAYSGYVYNLEVEEEHSYIANYIAVSNCRFFYENEPKVGGAIDFYCFAPDTQVLMADGNQKSISSIKPGDMVRSHDGSSNRVVRKFIRQAKEQMLLIAIEGGKSLKTTLDHEIFVSKESSPKKIRAKDLKFGDTLLFWDGNKFIPRKIINITLSKTYRGKLYDLEVDNAHSYTANNIACSNSRFPMNGFRLECENRKILKFYEHHVAKRLGLNEQFKMLSSEYFMLGDVFVHLDVDCPVCQGSSVDPGTGEQCSHADGSFRRMLILNPDWIEVQQSVLADEPVVIMVPDEELKRIVFYKQPKQIYDRIPNQIKQLVLTNKPIPLSNRTVSHLKHMPVPYGTYGTSLIRRLFTTLAYKTKIMTANWIVAERMILPVRVVKVGSDNRPATTSDISDIQQQLASTANDPNLIIVTHHNFEYEWYGACFDVNTDILTTYGWKRLSEINKDEVVATYNKQTASLEFQQIQEKHVHDFVSNDKLKMIHFNQRGVDVMVTPEHRMLVERNGKLQTVMSQDVKHYDKFLSSVNWKGEVPDRFPYRDSPLSHLSLDEYLQFAGYYISEGGSKRELSRGLSKDKQIQAASISQNIDSPCYENIERLVKKAYPSCSLHKDERRKVPTHTFIINNIEIARYLSNEFGMVAGEKCIPGWIKNLPIDKLKIFYDALMAGDGDTRTDRPTPRYRYTTTSQRLSDDFSEICLKLGYWPSTSLEKVSEKYPTRNDVYRVYWSEHRVDNKFTLNIENINHEDYTGKVYCVTVPSGFFVTRRNGKITIQGNSGKILQVTQEMEHVGKEILDGFMLNQSLLNGEMCLPDDHRVITESKEKRLSEVEDDEQILIYDSKEDDFRFEKPVRWHTYESVKSLYEFTTYEGDVIFKCTADHRVAFSVASCVEPGYSDKEYIKLAGKLFERHGDLFVAKAKDLAKIEELHGLQIHIRCLDTACERPVQIIQTKYTGTVFCPETSTGFFVAAYNGRRFITHNSGYQSAQVGVETLIRRIESWRHTLADWAEENIFKPVAEMQGFIDEEKSEEVGEPVFLYPSIKWNDLNLKDQTQWHQTLMQLHDKGVVSTQTLCEELDLNYDQEIKRLRYEQTQAGPAGGGLGAGGDQGMGMGMGMGGLPGGDMGGGMAGGMPGGDMGGGMDGGMPGGDMGGGMAGGAGGPMAAGGKVMKKGKSKEQEAELNQQPMPMIKLTSIEQTMAQMLEGLGQKFGWNKAQVFDRIRMQFPVENPTGGRSYALDFAFPHFKVAVECLHPDQLVPTNRGSKKAKDINQEDKLVGANGEYVSIKRTIYNQSNGLLNIKIYGMQSVQVTDNHPFWVARPKRIRVKKEEPTITRTREYYVPGSPVFLPASQIEKGDYLVIPKRKTDTEITQLSLDKFNLNSNGKKRAYNSNLLPKNVELTNDLGWLLGIYAAEGCYDPKKRSTIEFSFNMNEIEYISRTQESLENIFGLKSFVTTSVENSCSKVVASSLSLARWFYSLFGKIAPYKKLPPFLFNCSYEFKKSFIQGFMEGDGCIRNYDDAYRLISSSQALLLDIQSLSMSMGHFASLVCSRECGTICKFGDREHVTHGLWELVINFSGHTKAQYREDDDYFYLPVKSITEEYYNGPVVNFETSGKGIANHTYCVGNVVSHNCDGEIWHNQPEQIQEDKERDQILAQRGWTILRFDDKTIDQSSQLVLETIEGYIKKAMKKPKTASSDSEKGNFYCHMLKEGSLINLQGNYDKYNEQYLDRHIKHLSESFGSDRDTI